MEENDEPKADPAARDDAWTVERLRAAAGRTARRVRAAFTPDRLMAALCLVVALALAAPWVRVPVADLVDRDVAYSVPDLLATGQVVADRAQSLEDLVEKAREAAERAGQIIERVQDAAERVADARDERG